MLELRKTLFEVISTFRLHFCSHILVKLEIKLPLISLTLEPSNYHVQYYKYREKKISNLIDCCLMSSGYLLTDNLSCKTI